MDKLTKFVKEQSLQRSERSARVEEQVQWLIDLGSRGEKTAADFGLASNVASNVANLARDHNDEVAAAAIRALGDFGKEGAKHMSAVASGLNRSGEVCVAAATALAQFGPAALPYSEQLATCLHRPSDEASKAAVLAALGALRATQHSNVLVEFLEDKSMAVAAAACQALGKLGAAGAPEASRIAQKMKHPGTRFAAVTALGNLGPEVVKKNLPEIVSCLQDKDSLTRQAAASTLAVAPDAVLADPKSIVALLKDSQPGLRCAAALALGKCGASSAAEDVAVLLGDNGDDDSESYLAVGGGSLRSAYILRRPKCAALMSLSLMKSEKHLAAVSGALRDKSYEVRLCAIEALMQFGAAAKKHSTSIMSVLEDDVYLVRLKACQCIAAIGATDVIDNLPDLFHDEAPSVRQAALDALATYPDHAKTYSSQVFKCISDEYGCVRASAMRCLASMETVGQCYASTIAGELASQDPESRAAACETLGKLGFNMADDSVQTGEQDIQEYFDTAVKIARQAGQVVFEAFHKEKNIDTKSCGTDLVTETDKYVEELIIGILAEKFPSHSFIGEESVSAGKKSILTDNPTWIIDPIDGTTNFVHRYPMVAICIGLAINKQMEVGVVFNPIKDQMFTARRGTGAFCNGKKIHCSSVTDLSKALVITELGSSRDPEIINVVMSNLRRLAEKPIAVHSIRLQGSAALNMCSVASGEAELYYECGIHVWDIAAAGIIVEEAGGVTLDPSGKPLDLMARRILAAGNKELADQVSQYLDCIELPRD